MEAHLSWPYLQNEVDMLVISSPGRTKLQLSLFSGRVPCPGPQNRLANSAVVGPAQLARDPRSNIRHSIQINTRVHAQRLHKVHHVLRRDVARRARAVRAPAQTTDAAVKDPDAVLERHGRVDERLAVGVVKVHGNVLRPETC